MGKSDETVTPTKIRKKRRWIKYAVIAPFILTILYLVYQGFWAMNVANEHGCRLDEAGVYPCIVEGEDIGSILATKAGIVTLMSFMAPLVLLPFLILFLFIIKDAVVYIISKIRGNNRA